MAADDANPDVVFDGEVCTYDGPTVITEGGVTFTVSNESSIPISVVLFYFSSNFVAAYLVRTPFRTYPVNPAYDNVLGETCYPSLRDLPEVPDIVDVFRRSDAIPAVVDEAIEIGAKVVWLQLGLRHDAAAAKARDAGLRVVQDRCLKIEHARFHGGLHLAGFDTGVITSKRHRPI